MPHSKNKSASASLLRISLLGTNQSKPDAALDAFWGNNHIEEDEFESLLLRTAALQHLWHKSEIQREVILPKESTQAPAEEGKLCSLRSVQHLKVILGGQFSGALSEFMQLSATYKRVLPPQFLPKLLDQCLANNSLWKNIQPIIGKRGEWLLQQNPDWQNLKTEVVSDPNWAKATKNDRSALFEQRRNHAPEEAAEELKTIWSTIEVKEKAKLLKSLASHLSENDEDFLESCLEENRKEVRLAAAQHLFNLPKSALIKRLFAEAKKCVHLDKSKILIHLPDDIPDTTQKDGIYPTGSKVKGGLPLNWLIQIIGIIPFRFWENHFDLKAEKLMPFWAKCEYSEAIIPAIAAALNRHSEEETIRPFCKLLIANTDKDYWQNESCKVVLKDAPAPVFNQLTLKWLEAYGPLIPENSLPNYWLQISPHQWESQLSKIVIKGFQAWVEERGSRHWHIYHYKQILRKAAYQADPVLFAEIRNGFSFQFNKLGSWAVDIEELLQVLNFRNELRKEME